jgi:hypothetical protein
MSNPSVTSTVAAPSLPDALFGDLWPDRTTPGRPRLVAASAAAGLVAAVLVPYRLPGLALFIALVAVYAVVAVADRRLTSATHLGAGILCLLLTSTMLVRDAVWVVVLCLLAAFVVGAAALSGGRSVPGLVASCAAVPLAGLRGLPWLGRSLRGTLHPDHPRRSWWPVLRTTTVSLLLVLLFGALFASADALFARWADALLPDVTSSSLVLRCFVFVAFAGLALAGVFVALVPPQVERLAVPAGRPVRRPFEWLVPVGLVVGVFAAFVIAQLAVMFGGHAYLRRTTGLTYAEYVHQGFGQLTVATVLTLAVVAVAVRKASRATARDRLLLRVLLGALCALTLVVVASALYRVHLYEQAYGFTRLRLLVSVFESWLGVLVVLVLAAGVTLRGQWVPRAALVIGAVLLLGLAALNPDAYIARQNIDRFQQTGRVDWNYLAGLSADAAPALAELPATSRGCALDGAPQLDDWLAWNLGRQRAYDVLRTVQAPGTVCPSRP